LAGGFWNANRSTRWCEAPLEFQAIIEEIEADMAAQLERVREMERAGELAAIPQYDAGLH
jgi:hypothetical protein